MSSTPKSKAEWVAFEIASVAAATSATNGDHNREVHLARSVLNDMRKAEALCLIHPTEFLQELRTLIGRGHFPEAWVKLQTYRSEKESLEIDPEWNLELARLFAYANEWEKCIETCGKVLNLQPSPMSMMVALQVRSVAAFELGNFALALSDINRIRSLDRLYPNTQVAYYAELVDVKVAAAQGQLTLAKLKLSQIWQRQINAPVFTFDHLLTVLRVEAFVAMSAGHDATRILELAVWTALKQGDDFHTALSQFELYVTNPNYSLLDRRVFEAVARYQRISSLDIEVSGDAQSTTGHVLRQIRGKFTTKTIDAERQPSHVVLPCLNLVFRLNSENLQVEIIDMKKRTQLFDALCFIAKHSEGVTKAELFQALFGSQKYVSHLHDPTIYQVVSRLRKTWKVKIDVLNGVLMAPEVAVIGELA